MSVVMAPAPAEAAPIRGARHGDLRRSRRNRRPGAPGPAQAQPAERVAGATYGL